MRHQVFGTGHEEDIFVRVRWESFFSLARNAGYRELPTEPKGAVAVAGTVLERQLWPKPIAPWGGEYRDREISRPAEEVRLKRFANAFDRSTTLGQRDRRLCVFRCSWHCQFSPI